MQNEVVSFKRPQMNEMEGNFLVKYETTADLCYQCSR